MQPYVDGLCRCLHSQPAHRHARKGTDCAICACKRYRKKEKA